MGRFEGNLIVGDFSAYTGAAVPLRRVSMPEVFPGLTTRQREVLEMLSTGLTDKQIAYELSVSEATVKAHVSAILQKLGVESRTQAVIAASKIEAGQWQMGQEADDSAASSA